MMELLVFFESLCLYPKYFFGAVVGVVSFAVGVFIGRMIF